MKKQSLLTRNGKKILILKPYIRVKPSNMEITLIILQIMTLNHHHTETTAYI